MFFTLSLSILTGTQISAGGLVFDFIRIVGMGLIVGLAVSLAVSQVIKQIDDPMIEITFTTVAAYGAFAAADQFGYSGVIATVTSGMLYGNYGARTGMSPSTRISVETFWEYITFAMNSIVFLLIGFEAKVHTLMSSWGIILIAFLAITVGRGLVMIGVSGLLSFTRERIPAKWTTILTWGGLRGALPMVLVLSLATEMERGKMRAANAALSSLDHLSNTRFRDDEIISSLREDYQERIHRHQVKIREFHSKESEFRKDEIIWARRHLILVEKQKIIDAFHQGLFSQEV